jgi:hypothetical protein
MRPNLRTENPEQAFDVLPFLENYLAKETAKADPTLAKIRTNVEKLKAYRAEIIIHEEAIRLQNNALQRTRDRARRFAKRGR